MKLIWKGLKPIISFAINKDIRFPSVVEERSEILSANAKMKKGLKFRNHGK